MLIVIIPIVWLAVATIVVCACRVATRADAIAMSTEHGAPAPAHGAAALSLPGLTVWEQRDPLELAGLAASLTATRQGGARRLKPARRVGGSVATAPRVRRPRGRGPRCVT
jgi:hypothetical protein